MTSNSGSKDFSDESWLTLDEAAKAFKVSRRTLERLRGKGNLPGVRAGRFLKVRTIDVQRALTFENPTLALQSLISTPGETPAREWMETWSRYFTLLPDTSPVRQHLKAWSEEAGKIDGNLTLDEYEVRHALEAARSTALEAVMPIFVTILGQLPAKTPFQGILVELAPLLNPHINPTVDRD